jgi:hypothetical protein
MTTDDRRLNDLHADLFCIGAEVSAILDRHRDPIPGDAEYLTRAKSQALADWHAGRIPIWRRNPDGTQVFFGLECDPEACRRRDEYDAAQRSAMKRSDKAMKQPRRTRDRG